MNLEPAVVVSLLGVCGLEAVKLLQASAPDLGAVSEAAGGSSLTGRHLRSAELTTSAAILAVGAVASLALGSWVPLAMALAVVVVTVSSYEMVLAASPLVKA